MIRGRDLHHAAANWCLALACTVVVITAILVVHLITHIPLMVPL
jgi:hypothetical protein